MLASRASAESYHNGPGKARGRDLVVPGNWVARFFSPVEACENQMSIIIRAPGKLGPSETDRQAGGKRGRRKGEYDRITYTDELARLVAGNR